MANKSLFRTIRGKRLPNADTVNEAGGVAYAPGPRHALAQYAVTGCLNGAFYTEAETQLETVLDLCKQVDPAFIAMTAVHCREKGFMKDMPALLCAALAVRDVGLLERTFDRVIDNGKMLRNFVQIVRSGVTGRKSLGSAPKRLVRRWFDARSPEQVFRASVGQAPSIADILKMVHPKPASPDREALYGWLIGRDHNPEALPDRVKAFEAFKRGRIHALVGDRTSIGRDVEGALRGCRGAGRRRCSEAEPGHRGIAVRERRRARAVESARFGDDQRGKTGKPSARRNELFRAAAVARRDANADGTTSLNMRGRGFESRLWHQKARVAQW